MIVILFQNFVGIDDRDVFLVFLKMDFLAGLALVLIVLL